MEVSGRDHMVDVLMAPWDQRVGTTPRLLCDARTAFKAELRGSLSSMFGVVIITPPAEGHFEVG